VRIGPALIAAPLILAPVPHAPPRLPAPAVALPPVEMQAPRTPASPGGPLAPLLRFVWPPVPEYVAPVADVRPVSVPEPGGLMLLADAVVGMVMMRGRG